MWATAYAVRPVPVTWSPALKIAMLASRGYPVSAARLLLVKAI